MKCWLALALLAAPAPALAGGVVASGGWMRYLLPGLPAAGYLTLRNTTATPVALTGAASPACARLALHQSADASGMAMMMAVPALTLPAGGSVQLAPGGYHLMCMAPRMAVGDRISVSLNFADGEKLVTTLPVYGASGGP